MPNPDLSVPEKTALLALMTFVSEVSNRDLRDRYGFAIDGKVRLRLADLKLITSRRAADVPGRPYVLELTEEGWRWCREELGAPSDGMPRAYRLAYGLMNALDRHMRRSGFVMADVFVADEKPVEDRIRAAYARLAEPGDRLLLRRLREHLADLPREDVDGELRRLDRERAITLKPELNQKALTRADRDAAISVAGEAKHLVVIGRS